MPPASVPAERYQTLERIADREVCSAHRARDLILEREVTLVCCEDDGILATFRQRYREVARLADAIGIEVYDANPRELVLRSVDAATADRLLDYLAPDSTSTGVVVDPGPPVESTLDRTAPALGVAAASALLLVLAGLLAIPGTSTGGTALAGELPAVVGVASEPPADDPLVTAAELRRTPMPELTEPELRLAEPATREPAPEPATADPAPAAATPGDAAAPQERRLAAADGGGPPAHAQAGDHDDRGGPPARGEQGGGKGNGNGR